MRIPITGELTALLTSGRPGVSGIAEALIGKALSGLVLEKRADGTVVLAVGEQKIPLLLAGGTLALGQGMLFRLIRDKMGGLFLEILQEGEKPKMDRVEALAWGRLAARWVALEPALEALRTKDSLPGLLPFLEPFKKFFQVVASSSPAGVPTKLPDEIKAAFSAGETLARNARVSPQIQMLVREWIAEAKQLLPLESPRLSPLSPLAPALPPLSIKVISGGEALFKLSAEPIRVKVESSEPDGRAIVSLPEGAKLEVFSQKPLVPGAFLTVVPRGENLIEVPVNLPGERLPVRSLSPALPELTVPVTRDEMVRQAVEFKLIQKSDDILPEPVRQIFERVEREAVRPGVLPEEPGSLLRQLLFTLSKGADPATMEPALAYQKEALTFGPKLFALIEALIEAVPMPQGFYGSWGPLQDTGGETSPGFSPRPVPAALPNEIPALAEVIRKLILSLVPVREGTEGRMPVLNRELRDSHEQSGQFLEGKIYRGSLTRLWNDKGMLSDLKANLLRLPQLMERLDLPPETRARLLQETSRLIQSIEAFQVKNLAEPETHQWVMPLTGRDGPSTALVTFRRRGRRKKMDRDNASLRLNLALSALGAVEARVETRGGALWIDFLLDRSEWEPLFKATLPELSERLQNTGYRIGGLSISAGAKKEKAAARHAVSGLDLQA